MTTNAAPKKKVVTHVSFAHMWDGEYIVRVHRGRERRTYRPHDRSAALTALGFFFMGNDRIVVHLPIYPTIYWTRPRR